MCAATGVLRAVGYEEIEGVTEPQAVTRIREIAAAPAENRAAAWVS
jgi:hypothetical protein